MRPAIKIASALILCVGFADAFAANVNVSVGGYTATDGGYYGGSTTSPELMFNPANVTINVGDTVTFTNLPQGGLLVPHNVHADDNSFRCANGCDASGGNGTPAANQWTSAVTFTKAGVFKYHCDIHFDMGMTGTITVKSVATTGQNIVGGLSGNWYNPSANQGGHGFQIEILPNNGMLAIWFVFNPAGTAQNWLFSQGSYNPSSNDVVLPVFLEQGGAFPPNFDASKVSAPPWGALELKFSDCNNGTAEYTPNEAAVNAQYGHVSFPIARLSSIAGTTCP